MELKVWVEGIQRIVCGVTEATTCQDVVFALAHATGKVGRFTLIERWRNNERLLAPTENPLKILMKWGEYSSDVQFILQRSDQPKNTALQSPQQILRQQQRQQEQQPTEAQSVVLVAPQGDRLKENMSPIERGRETRKSFTGGSLDLKSENVGIVRGVPQKSSPTDSNSPLHSPQGSNEPLYAGVVKPAQSSAATVTKSGEFTSADVRNALDRKTTPGLAGSSENILEGPPISSNGALVPPPYRDPPPPRNSPLQHTSKSVAGGSLELMEAQYLHNGAQYRDLIQLIKLQREKISMQQADLTKYDAEIVYLENKEREQAQQLEAIAREISKTDQIFRQGNEQYVEEENELVRQQEKTLKSEITLLRSKLANCETELLQCKNKIRHLMDDIQIEQRVINRQFDTRQQMERQIVAEVDRIQAEIEQIVKTAESSNKTMENLKKEVSFIETAIAEKKKQVEHLVNEMKEVNLQSLAVAPSEEIRHLLEGSNRPGSTRRIIGSPRQLENAVPTSKNPHGVWV
ncbi:ras association domain-containing protein 8 isoform X2 [Phlebotomus papatasi]|uniref:ras association domain-containing protein 8 isoform X2 n=1 Tax=Phlebotomus papatasi TaxID=29031 RepID=UPI002483ABDE|nr:ras association domain-containing protein 8 isoform X2 [Phlebotomus papatasi]XP_055714047.1 ras association domain-containing protein 8 isoform X2 [Phlebotomus papatasi]